MYGPCFYACSYIMDAIYLTDLFNFWNNSIIFFKSLKWTKMSRIYLIFGLETQFSLLKKMDVGCTVGYIFILLFCLLNVFLEQYEVIDISFRRR